MLKTVSEEFNFHDYPTKNLNVSAYNSPFGQSNITDCLILIYRLFYDKYENIMVIV